VTYGGGVYGGAVFGGGDLELQTFGLLRRGVLMATAIHLGTVAPSTIGITGLGDILLDEVEGTESVDLIDDDGALLVEGAGGIALEPGGTGEVIPVFPHGQLVPIVRQGVVSSKDYDN
jgi:hypothetical protein